MLRELRICCLSVVVCVASFGIATSHEPSSAKVRGWLNEIRQHADDESINLEETNAAANHLLKLGPEDRDVLPELIRALDDEKLNVRTVIVGAIGRMGPEAKAAVPALCQQLRLALASDEGDEDLAYATMSTLGKIAEDAVSAVGDLAAGLPGLFTERRTRHALRRIGTGALPAVRNGLSDPRPEMRDACATLLSEIDQALPTDIDAIIRLLDDTVPSQRAASRCVLYTLGVGEAARQALVQRGPSVAPKLRAVLDGDNLLAKQRAAIALCELKLFDSTTLKELARAIGDKWTCYRAIEVIKQMPEQQRCELAELLHTLLDNPNPKLDDDFCYFAAKALIELGSVNEAAVRILLGRLQMYNANSDDRIKSDENWSRNFVAAWNLKNDLVRCGKDLKPIEHDLATLVSFDSPRRMRWQAAALLAQVDPDHHAIRMVLPELARLTRGDDSDIRRDALQAAIDLGKSGIPFVLVALRNGERMRRPYLCAADGKQALADEILRLKSAIDRDDEYLYQLFVFASIEHPDSRFDFCLPILIEKFIQSWRKPGEPKFQSEIGPQRSIASFGSRAVPHLLRLLEERQALDSDVTAILECLSMIGSDAKSALPALIDLAEALPEWFAVDVAHAMCQIGPTVDCIPGLVKSLDGYRWHETTRAIVALGQPAIPDAIGLLQSGDHFHRDVAAKLLRTVGASATQVIAPIDDLLKRGVGDDVQLMRILSTFGPRAATCRPQIVARFASRSVRIRSAACATLAAIDPSAELNIALLQKTLMDDFAEVRAAAADALGSLHVHSKSAEPALRGLLTDDFATVRNAAHRAITAITENRPSHPGILLRYFDPDGPSSGPSTIDD